MITPKQLKSIGERRLRFSIRTLLIVVAEIACAFAWFRTEFQPTWTLSSPENVIYLVRNEPWPSSRTSLEYVLFLPPGRSHGSIGSMRQFESHADDLHFEGHIDESHTVWVAVGGTYVPHSGQVSLESLLNYLTTTPSQLWSADGLVDFVQANGTDST